MRFLYTNEAAEWCRERGAEISDPFALVADPGLTHHVRLLFAPNGSVGLEAAVEAACLRALAPFEEALLWVREWGIWGDSEDWPRYYAARGERGERLSLEEKPGHLFTSSDAGDLRLFLGMVLEQGWGGDLLAGYGGRITKRLWISHDGYVDLCATGPTEFSLPVA